MCSLPIYQVDAFADAAFGGNPAGVVPDARGLDVPTMQRIAREMALSETAFILPPEGDGDYRVRFFTPTDEVDLCGHATVAAFHLLAELGELEPPVRLRQETGAGLLEVHTATDGKVMMAQRLPTIEPCPQVRELAALLGTDAISGEVQIVSTGLPDIIIPMRDRESLWALRPRLSELGDFCREHGVISVHAFSFDTVEEESTVHCRDFSPAVGVNEESATGTASGATAAYLAHHRLVPWSPRMVMQLEQGHILGRPSLIEAVITTAGDEITGVEVGGCAYTVLKGTLHF